MALTNNQRIGRALELLAAGLGPFVDQMLSRRFGEDWPSAISERVPANAKADTYVLLRAMTAFWREGFAETLGRTERSWAGELADIRNKWAHNEVFTSDQTLRALDTAQLLERRQRRAASCRGRPDAAGAAAGEVRGGSATGASPCSRGCD
jgi:hypothetical protein